MSMELYNKTSAKISELITKEYSTSFSLGIMAFNKKFREPIYSVYGFVRLADEIVDTFHDFEKRKLLDEFRAETFRAIETGFSLNPIIHTFQEVVNKYGIDHEFIEAFLDSMAMDLDNNYYEAKDYDNYIYGSAEVVGLMCLRVFCEGDRKLFDELKSPATALGSAFQKVNFLRDIKSDIEERGRIYMPGVNNFEKIDEKNKILLEEKIASEFTHALEGIKKLPEGCRLGVYSAYLYYFNLFNKIKESKVDILLKKRVRVSNARKLMLLTKSIIEVKVLKTC